MTREQLLAFVDSLLLQRDLVMEEQIPTHSPNYQIARILEGLAAAFANAAKVTR